MKKFNTLTEYDILNNAYDNLLALWSYAKNSNEECKKMIGHDSIIEQRKIEKYWSQLQELRSELIRLEELKNS